MDSFFWFRVVSVLDFVSAWSFRPESFRPIFEGGRFGLLLLPDKVLPSDNRVLSNCSDFVHVSSEID